MLILADPSDAPLGAPVTVSEPSSKNAQLPAPPTRKSFAVLMSADGGALQDGRHEGLSPSMKPERRSHHLNR